MDTDDIKAAFKGGHTDYIDAIIALQSRGMDSKDAEALVTQWNEEPKKSWLDVLPDLPVRNVEQP